MFLFVLSLVTFFLCAWLLIRWWKVKSYWSKRGVPHNPPHPIFGSLTFLQRENPSLWMRKVYNQFKTPYVGIWLLWRPALVINSPEIARRVLVKDADFFRNRYLSSGKSDPHGALNIFTVNDPTWTTVRRRLTSVFTAAKLKSLNGITISKSKALIERIGLDCKNNVPIELREIFTDFTTDVIGESAFGVTSNCVTDGHSIMRQVTKEFMEFGLHRGLSWSSIFFFPDLVDIFRFTFFPKKTMKLLRTIFRTVIEQRGGYEKEVKDTRDLLDALLKIKQEAIKDNEDISEDLLLAQAAVFLLGGFDTSGTTLCWVVYELAWNPKHQFKRVQFPVSVCFAITINKSQGQTLRAAGVDLRTSCFSHGQLYVACSRVTSPDSLYILAPGSLTTNVVYREVLWGTFERLYQNILELKRKIGNRSFDATILSEANYIDNVIKETLRRYPPMGWLDRIAIKDYQIDDNLTITAGTPVYVNGVSTQMDPQYFPEPEVFNPDRFLPENERNILPYTFMPFGEGPRSCIGMRFAYQTLRQGLADLLLNYEFKVIPNTPKPSEVTIEKNGMFLVPDEKLYIQFVKRDNEFVSSA